MLRLLRFGRKWLTGQTQECLAATSALCGGLGPQCIVGPVCRMLGFPLPVEKGEKAESWAAQICFTYSEG